MDAATEGDMLTGAGEEEHHDLNASEEAEERRVLHQSDQVEGGLEVSLY